MDNSPSDEHGGEGPRAICKSPFSLEKRKPKGVNWGNQEIAEQFFLKTFALGEGHDWRRNICGAEDRSLILVQLGAETEKC